MDKDLETLQLKFHKLAVEQGELIDFLNKNSVEYRKLNEIEEELRLIEEEIEGIKIRVFQVEIIKPGKYITWYNDNLGKVYSVIEATDRENAYMIADNEEEWMEYLEKDSCRVID